MKAEIYQNGSLGFYDPKLHTQIPDSAIDISDADYQAHISGDLRQRVGDQWVPYTPPGPTIADLKLEKADELKAACTAVILAGITNNALGADHIYPTSRDDQNNLSGLRQYAQLKGATAEPYKFWCADVAGQWMRRGHTAAQLELVAVAVVEHVQAQQDHYESKLTDLGAAFDAGDQVAMAAIAW